MPERLPIFPLNDAKTAVSWLAQVTRKSDSEVIETLKTEAIDLGITVRTDLERLELPRYQWTDELLQYYKSSQSFVFESFAWNTTRTKEKLRRRVGQILIRAVKPGAKILCYGDGLGFDSAFLSRLGFNVTYYEVGEPCIQFAQQVFRENHVSVNICRDLESLTPQAFDAVVCLDVLEHVPNPPELVSKLSPLLRDNGTFVVHAPFWYIHPMVGTHLESNVRYSGCVKKIFHANGLYEVDAGFLWCPLLLRKSSTPPRKGSAATLRIRFSQFVLSWSRLTTWPTVAAIRTIAKARPRIQI